MRKTDTHLYFWDTIYSQWYKKDNLITEDGISYSSAEKYMMVKKAEVFGAHKIKEEMIKSDNPRTIKHLGRSIQGFTDTLWDKWKIKIVAQGNYLKFTQNPELKEQMIKDKDLILVEASPVDKIWGIGLAAEDDRVLNEKEWQGQNLLGVCITLARTQILKEI